MTAARFHAVAERARIAGAAAVLALTLGPLPAAGHDFWLEPSRFEPAPGELVTVGLRVGEPAAGAPRPGGHGAGEPVAGDPGRIERFAALGPEAAGEDDPIAGLPGADPAGALRPAAPGPWILVYRSRPSAVVLDGPHFEVYLAEEGLDHVLAARAERGESGEPGREIFSRCAKALVRVAGEPAAGDGEGAPADRAAGLRLELVAGADPWALGPAGELPVTLLFEGAPLAGSLVEAYGPGGRHLSARSDRGGRASFRLDAAGRWLLTAVHMVPAPAGSGADWESVWASLALALPEG